MHAVEVAFESIYMRGPEPTELSQPGIHLLERFRFQPVETALCVHRGFHETGLTQHSQVLGHGRLRHTKLALDLSHRLLGRDQEAQYRAAVRLRDDFEHRFHALDIRHTAYACQCIYRAATPRGRWSDLTCDLADDGPRRRADNPVGRECMSRLELFEEHGGKGTE